MQSHTRKLGVKSPGRGVGELETHKTKARRSFLGKALWATTEWPPVQRERPSSGNRRGFRNKVPDSTQMSHPEVSRDWAWIWALAGGWAWGISCKQIPRFFCQPLSLCCSGLCQAQADACDSRLQGEGLRSTALGRWGLQCLFWKLSQWLLRSG